MLIESLKVFTEENEIFYKFGRNTMIYSIHNSKGKTTLIRFILYALGYQIPATEGIGNFDNMEFEILIKNNEQNFSINREKDIVKVKINKESLEFKIPEQENELHCLIFGIENDTILNNLLAVFYIDQEKGWTLLNRGKIIGNIRFNIEEFIAGISNINIQNLISEKKVLNREIQKYRYIKNTIDINNEFNEEDDDTIEEYEQVSMNELIQLQKEKQLELKKIKNEIKRLEKSILKNSEFGKMIENYGLIIEYQGQEIQLTRNNLFDFDRNQNLMKIKIQDLKLQLNKINKEQDKIIEQINNKNTLFQTEDLLETMQRNIEKLGIDISKIDKIIRQLNNKRNTINNDIKNKLVFKNDQLKEYYDIIYRYSKELGIEGYISDNSPKYVLMNKLKGLSGRVLAQMSFVFKLSYIKAIENAFNVCLPIIMDSPRTNELSEESTNQMMEILKRDFSNHQIITASIYKNKVIDFDIINLENGLFSVDLCSD
mgnify:FL=1